MKSGAKGFVEDVKRAERMRAEEDIGEIRVLVLHATRNGFEVVEHANDALGARVRLHGFFTIYTLAHTMGESVARSRGMRGGELDAQDSATVYLKHEDPTIREVWSP